MGVKLLCGGRQNRFIDLMIAQNGKDHGSHFPRHMTDDRHVFEPFCGFLLVIRAEHGIALYGDLRRHPDASAQIRRAPFGHMRVRSLELAGLVDRRIDANIGCELVRRRKTGDISDFAENDGSNNRSNAGNRRDRRIKALKQSRYFFFQSVSLSGERLDLVEHQENQRGIRAVTVFNAEAVSCKLPEFTRLPLAKVTVAAVPEQLCQLIQMCVGKLLRRRILFQNRHGGLAENRIELRLVFRKNTVDQSDQFSLEVAGHVDQIEAVPAQLLQRQQTILCDVALGIAPETDQLGDDEGILGIGFDLADEHIPHGASLDRIEQNDVIAVLAQPCKERQPVMRGGLHRKYNLAFDVRVFSDFLQHEIVPGAVVADREWTLNGLTVRCDHADLVAALGDIDTDNEHNIHLNVDLQTVLMVL